MLRLLARIPPEAVLLAIIVAWSINFTIAKVVINHGVQPIVYSSLRYCTGAALMVAITLQREGSLRMARRDLTILLGVGLAGTVINQLAFVYSLKLAGVTTTALIMGVVPVLTALVAAAVGVEKLRRVFVFAGIASFAGVALVAVGSGGPVGGNILGELLALTVAGSWAMYTVSVNPLTRRYSALRIFTILMVEGAVLLPIVGSRQIARQSWSLPASIWALMVVSTVIPLVVGNVLWVWAVGKVGPSRASLFANLQPLFATVFAVLLATDSLTWIQAAGGLLIGVAIAIARRPAPEPKAVLPP